MFYRVTACLLLVAFVTACASSSKSSSETTQTTKNQSAVNGPCDYVTKDEVATALKSSVTSAEQQSDTKCAYTAADKSVVTIEVSRTDADTEFAAYKSAGAMMHSASSGPKIGDETYWGPMDSTVAARKGHGYVAVDLRGVLNANARSVGTALARQALARL